MSDFDDYKPEYVGNGLYSSFIRKQVGNVRETQQNLIVEFLTPEGQIPIVGQGVVIPKDLGFTPQTGMKAIYDIADYIGADGKVSFYNDEGELLFAAERKKQTWSVVTKDNEKDNQSFKDAKLMEIFQIRINALKEVNPEKFAGEGQDKLLVASSLAAQDWIEQLNPTLENIMQDEDSKSISDIHKKYGLDRGGNINPFLVKVLVFAYLNDIQNGVIDKKGNITGDIAKSDVMRIPHNSTNNGVPANAVETVNKANALVIARKQAILGQHKE
jgi:hypothetical protein